MKTSVHLEISGRVQGVWFRASTKDKALELGLTGWVRNTPKGSVEAIFEGEEDIVKKMIDWCHHGPPLAKVENIIMKKQQPIIFKDFSIKYR